MNVDFKRIREKFLRSKKYWNKVKEIIKKSAEEFEKDLDSQLIAERIFEILSQTILDICTHILAQSEERAPQSYSDCIKKLGTLGIITSETSEKLVSLIKMRNIIIYQYGDINYKLLIERMRKLHRNFLMFEKQILDWIQIQEEKK